MMLSKLLKELANFFAELLSLLLLLLSMLLMLLLSLMLLLLSTEDQFTTKSFQQLKLWGTKKRVQHI